MVAHVHVHPHTHAHHKQKRGLLVKTLLHSATSGKKLCRVPLSFKYILNKKIKQLCNVFEVHFEIETAIFS